MKGYVHSSESFGTVDGPGIRYVLFLKGCPLRCKYCHNPDTWLQQGASEVEPSEIVERVLKYKNYYKNGGITISGGEPLLQIDFLIELTKLCKENDISTAVDTSGIIYDEENEKLIEKFDELIKYVDLFLLDIKHIDNEKCIELTGKPNTNTLSFAKYLDRNNKSMWIRQVLIPGVTNDEDDLKKEYAFIKSLKMVEKVEVLPYHTLGVKKYEELKIPYRLEGVLPPTNEEVKLAKQILRGEKN